MIYEKWFQFSSIGFIFLQILYINWYLIIQSNSQVNYTFLSRFLLQGLINKYIFVLVLWSCTCLFFCMADVYHFKKRNTSNTYEYNVVTVSILQSLNSCLPHVPVLTLHTLCITLFCSLNIGILCILFISYICISISNFWSHWKSTLLCMIWHCHCFSNVYLEIIFLKPKL